MKTSHVLFVIASSMLSVGCTTSDHSWTTHPPRSKDSPWAQIMPPFAFSNAPLPSVLAELQRLALCAGGPEVVLRISTDDEVSSRVDECPRVTISAERVSLEETIRIIGQVTSQAVVFNQNVAVFTPLGHGDGQTDVVLQGRCRSKTTATPVSALTLICTRVAMSFDNGPTTSIHGVHTDNNGRFQLSLPVSSWSDIAVVDGKYHVFDNHPRPQRIEIIAVAEGYYSARLAVDVVWTNLQYDLDIQLDR